MQSGSIISSYSIIPSLFGQTRLTAPYQTESQSPDPLRHFLNNFTTDNAESPPTLNTLSFFGSKTVEKKPKSCLELLKHLKPAKTVENKTKSPELMKYLAPIRQDTREFPLVNTILRTSTFR